MRRNEQRKIYEEHNGPIPVDSEGRTFDVHHKDGNHSNNDPSNLESLSIADHFWVHWIDGDYGACRMIAKRMKVSPEVISELSKRTQKNRLDNLTHNFLDKSLQKELGERSNKKRIADGSHNFLGSNVNKEMVKKGIHPGQKERTCPWCGRVGRGPWMFQKHFDNCKHKDEK